MAKTKKRQHHAEGTASLVFEGEEFPAAITVELWRRKPKGKRILVGSRQYEMLAGQDDAAAPVDPTAPRVDKQPRAKDSPIQA